MNGSTKFAAERRGRIYEYALRNGSVSVTELADMLGVVENTVRRDLDALHEEGKLLRSHGGATLRERGTPVPHYSQTRDTHLEEKSRIGQAALKYVPQSGLVFINSGSTTYQLALRMPFDVGGTPAPRRPALQVVTTSLEIAGFLAARVPYDVHILGGRINPDSLNSTGSLSEKALDEFYWDMAFIGVEAVDLSRGITTSYLDSSEARIIEHSRKTIVLCDSSKFGRISNVLVTPLKAVDVIVTDRNIDSKIARALSEMGIEVDIAGPAGEDNA